MSHSTFFAKHRCPMAASRISLRYVLVLAVATLAASPAARAQQAPSIDRFFEDFTAEWVRRDPDLATATRYFSGAEQDQLEQQLTPNTRAWQLERIRLAQRGLRDLGKYDIAKLSEAQRVSAALMRWQLESVVQGEQYMDYRYPLDQRGGPKVQLVESLT